MIIFCANRYVFPPRTDEGRKTDTTFASKMFVRNLVPNFYVCPSFKYLGQRQTLGPTSFVNLIYQGYTSLAKIPITFVACKLLQGNEISNLFLFYRES